MPTLPSAAFATLDVEKLRDYSLDSDHPRGRHKARVFKAALGISAEDSEWLRGEILRCLISAEAVFVRSDVFGARFNVDLSIARLGRQAVVRTAWIVASDTAPRLVSCRVL